jgi:hypothetical protein
VYAYAGREGQTFSGVSLLFSLFPTSNLTSLMMQHRLLFHLSLIVLLLGPAAQSTLAQGKATPHKAPSRALSQPGDTVWIIVNPVKANKREQFEKFVHEIFFDKASDKTNKLSPQDRQAFRQTRILHPVAPEADGTWSYIFFVDPVLKGVDYGIEPMLVKLYGEVKAQEYMRVLNETGAGEQKSYKILQSRH